MDHGCVFDNGKAQPRPDPGDHFHHSEGLAQVVVCAQVKADDFVIFASLGGGHNDRDRGSGGHGPELFENRDPVLSGYHFNNYSMTAYRQGEDKRKKKKKELFRITIEFIRNR